MANEIGIADKTTLDAMNTKVGTNADASGITTLFARLAQIATYIDTLETLLGTTGASAGSGSVFARLAQIAGYVDTVEASLATIVAYVDTLETKLSRTFYFGCIKTTTTSYQTALSVSGSGVLEGIAIQNPNGGGTVRVTVDGTVLLTNTIGTTSRAYKLAINQNGLAFDGASEDSVKIQFYTSLVIEILSSGSSTPVSVGWGYHK